jgi:hypothetical protein
MMENFMIESCAQQNQSESEEKTGQRFFFIEVTSYKIHILAKPWLKMVVKRPYVTYHFKTSGVRYKLHTMYI